MTDTRTVLNSRHRMAGLFTQREAAERAGMTNKQLQYLYDTGVVMPTVPNPMKHATTVGVATSRWSPFDVFKLAMIKAAMVLGNDVRAEANRLIWSLQPEEIGDSDCYLIVSNEGISTSPAHKKEPLTASRRAGDWTLVLPLQACWAALLEAEASVQDNGSPED